MVWWSQACTLAITRTGSYLLLRQHALDLRSNRTDRVAVVDESLVFLGGELRVYRCPFRRQLLLQRRIAPVKRRNGMQIQLLLLPSRRSVRRQLRLPRIQCIQIFTHNLQLRLRRRHTRPHRSLLAGIMAQLFGLLLLSPMLLGLQETDLLTKLLLKTGGVCAVRRPACHCRLISRQRAGRVASPLQSCIGTAARAEAREQRRPVHHLTGHSVA